jgi:type I restriction enzyme M protein
MNREQLKKLERDLWAAADKLRANSDLKASEYSTPVLGLIFLKFADNKYRQHEDAILQEYNKLKGSRPRLSSMFLLDTNVADFKASKVDVLNPWAPI